MQFSKTLLMMLAVGSVLLCASAATAQQPTRTSAVQPRPFGQVSPAGYCDAGQCVPTAACDGCDAYGGCNCCLNCDCGANCRCGPGRRCGLTCRCGKGRCPHRWAASVNGGACGFGGNPHYSHCGIGRLLCCCNPYHVCTYPPDHGWAPPAQRPIWPASASYRRNFPAAWTGEDLGVDPGFRYRTVYMPTDTSQLGFYYQHTPFWRSRPNMIPPVPHPAEWHTPDTGVVFTGWEDDLGYAPYGCPTGTIIDEDGSTVPSPTYSTPQDAGQQAEPVPMMEAEPPTPYSPVPDSNVAPPVPPSGEEAAPPPPETTNGRSASLPNLVPVPRN